MSIFQLVDKDNTMLKIPLSGVSEDCDRKELKENLIETMKNFKGIGLSANQVGIMERVFVMYDNFSERSIMACFNPQIVGESKETTFEEEGCLSYPGLFVKIRRPESVRVEYEDENGTKHEQTLVGLEGRVFQHEFDHMEGSNFTKRASRVALDMAKKRRKKMIKKYLDKATQP